MGFIQISHIILLSILIKWSKCLVLDPICQSCLQINSSLVSKFYSEQFKVNLTLFNLPGFSLSTIVVDFRHLNEFPTDSNNLTIFDLIFEITDTSSQTKSSQNVNDTIIGTNIYELQTTAQQTLIIYFIIREQYKEFEYLLRESVSLNLSYSNNRIPLEDSSYVVIVSSQDVPIFSHKKNINLPDNKPNLADMKNYYLENQENYNSFMSSTVYSESTMYWSTDQQFAVPYFPYFSDCQWEGNMMHIMDALENETDCQLVPINETQSINEFSFGSSATADQCTIKRKCTVTADNSKTEYPYWLTLPSGLSLFQISQEKIPWQQFSYNMNFGAESLVSCDINTSMGSNSSDTYPLKVKLSMGYYQVSSTEKRIISCIVQYDLYVTSTTSFTYQLEIHSYPMNHTYILLNFGFKWYVYMIVFVIIGIIENIENGLLWVYHYFIASERKEIKVMMYFRIIREILKGIFMALIIQMVVLVVICSVMNGKLFQTTFYDSSNPNGSSTPRVLFDYILQDPTTNYDSNDMQNLRSGRMGIAFITIGVIVMIINSKYFVGKSKPKEQEKDFKILGRTLRPLEWVQGKFLLVTFVYIILLFFLIYFAYSLLYSDNIWTFIVVMKVLQVIIQEITKNLFNDILPGTPFKIIADVIGFLNTLSAADLYDFLFGSLIDVAVTMIEKIYIFQIEQMIFDKISEKSQQFQRFYVNLMNEEDGEDEDGGNRESDGERLGTGDEPNGDSQQVFIYREAQEVQFFEQEIKQAYNFTRMDEDTQVISQSKETDEQRRLKKRYFQSLNRQYRYQRQLLLNRDQTKGQEKGKTSNMMNNENKKQKQNKSNDNNNNNNGESSSQIEEDIDEEERKQFMQEQSQIFQILMDLMGMIYTSLFNPFVVFLLWIIYDESQILSNYGISYSTVILYLLSSFVIGLFSVINIILIFSMLENYIGMSFQQQINDVLMRFYQRKTFWKADGKKLNDKKLIEEMLGADQYCLSSQLFFILTIYLGGMFSVIIGIAIIFQTSYNLFDDVATIPIVFFWIGFLNIFIFLVKKVGIFLNVWDYKKYKEAVSDDDGKQGGNLYGIMDQKELEKIMEENSDFKTENIIFAPIEELPKFKKFFNTPKKVSFHQQSNDDSQHEQNLQQEEEKDKSSSSDQKRTITTNKKRTQNHPNLQLQQKHEHQQIILAQKRIQTICKKLEPLFNKEAFRLDYSMSNSQFIKENIEKILPLVDYLPELQEFKNIPTTNDKNGEGKFGIRTWQSQQQKSSQKKRQENSSNNTMDPVVTEMILEWLRVTEKVKQKRITNGLQAESKVKKCSFCYQTWGLYYGQQGGTCLSCSMKINKMNKKKEEKAAQQKKEVKPTLLSSSESNLRKGSKRKSTKRKNKLNIIAEEEDLDDEDSKGQSGSEDHDSEDQIHNGKSKRKQHRR